MIYCAIGVSALVSSVDLTLFPEDLGFTANDV
jgi:hypothetical protein